MLLDRWQLTVEPNGTATGEDAKNAKPELPLNVVNNYFSFGVDAHIALEFHEARGNLDNLIKTNYKICIGSASSTCTLNCKFLSLGWFYFPGRPCCSLLTNSFSTVAVCLIAHALLFNRGASGEI